jgi:hypothetical protein
MVISKKLKKRRILGIVGAARPRRPTCERDKNQDVRIKRRSGIFIFFPNDR